MAQYLPIVVLMVLALLFGVLSLVASRICSHQIDHRLQRKRRTNAELSPAVNRQSAFRSHSLSLRCCSSCSTSKSSLYPYAVERGALGMYGLWAIIGFSVVFFLDICVRSGPRRTRLGSASALPRSVIRRINGLSRSLSCRQRFAAGLEARDMQPTAPPKRHKASNHGD